MAPLAPAILDQRSGGMELHDFAGEEPQMLGGFLAGLGLIEAPSAYDYQRIRSQNKGLRMMLRHRRRLCNGERLGDLLGFGALKTRLHRALVDVGGDALIGNPRSIEHRPARGRFAGENQRDSHMGVPTPPSLAGLRPRSCARRMIAAAVSSIERRVTSITGQPLSPNIRLANCSSALTLSLST